jgi:hypothetical protein
VTRLGSNKGGNSVTFSTLCCPSSTWLPTVLVAPWKSGPQAKSASKSVQNWNKNQPKIGLKNQLQNWPKIGPRIALEWALKLAQNWSQYWLKRIPKWPTKLSPKSSQNQPKLGLNISHNWSQNRLKSSKIGSDVGWVGCRSGQMKVGSDEGRV